MTTRGNSKGESMSRNKMYHNNLMLNDHIYIDDSAKESHYTELQMAVWKNSRWQPVSQTFRDS